MERGWRGLEPLGVRAGDEAVYRGLLENPDAGNVADVARLLGIGLGPLRAALARLESAGLVIRSMDRRAFSPAPPTPAIEVLLRRREEELSEVRLGLSDLQGLYQATRRDPSLGDVVEIVLGRPAITQRFEQLQRSARRSLWAMMRPPWPPREETENPTEDEVIERGVLCRGIYDAAALEDEDELSHIQESAHRGEVVRILAGVPAKLVGIDESAVLVRAGVGDPDMRDGALIIHPSPLLDALASFFEASWHRATSFGSSPSSDGAAAGELSEDVLDVVALLVDGVSDKVICSRLGISRATLSRRIQRAMDVLGARTRFHAGVLAERRGLLVDR